MSFGINGYGPTTVNPTTPTPPAPKPSFGEKIGDAWANFKDKLGLGGVNSAAKTAFLKFDTNQNKGLEVTEFGIIGAVMGQGQMAFSNAAQGNQSEVSLGQFKTYVKRAFADEFKGLDGDKNGYLAGAELQGLAMKFPNVAFGTWDPANAGYVTERRYMDTRANQLASA